MPTMTGPRRARPSRHAAGRPHRRIPERSVGEAGVPADLFAPPLLPDTDPVGGHGEGDADDDEQHGGRPGAGDRQPDTAEDEEHRAEDIESAVRLASVVHHRLPIGLSPIQYIEGRRSASHGPAIGARRAATRRHRDACQ